MGLVLSYLRSFLPGAFPRFARRSYTLELITVICFSATLGIVEGGVISNIAKRRFEKVVEEESLNFYVALLFAAPDLANILSFFWSGLSHGRPKIPLINALQFSVIVLIALMALTPVSGLGLFGMVAIVILARVCWSGIITLRPTVWRSNYPAIMRATAVGNFQTMQYIMAGIVGVVVGSVLNVHPEHFWLLVLCVASVGFGAFFATRRQRVRRETRMLRAELDSAPVMKPWQGPLVVWRVLHKDRMWARFMLWMFVLGLGNMLMGPTLAIVLRDQFQLGYLRSILITSSITALVMPLSIPMWARYLDRSHVVQFRAKQTWMFVFSACVACAGVLFHRVELLYLTAVLQGISYGGGTLAWNLGHVDFAPPTHTSQYMASHVTLNGIRGLLAPFVAVGLYNGAFMAGFSVLGLDVTTTAAALVLAVSAVMCAIGAAGFGRLLTRMGDRATLAKARSA
ncbi:MAG: MFS transporter [Phycisphaerae bacterium]|nr:MFS transporter [Phycisphaerae bacterium]MBN8596285.1 MFS transporter [Planctomycetota bacterium]